MWNPVLKGNLESSSVSLEDARLLAVQLLAALDSTEPSGPTVDEMFSRYMLNHGDRCRSARRIRQLYGNHLHILSPRFAVSVKPQEIVALHQEIGRRIGPATANRVLEILRAAYNCAIKWGDYVGTNPCLRVSAFPLQSRDRYLSSKNELRRFLEALETMRSKTFRNFIKTCLFTAARVANVQSMQWGDLDLENRTWRIPMTKSGKPVILPLIPEAIASIESQRGKDEIWVFPGHSTGKTGHIVNPARAWQRLCKKAGIENLRMHDLRRTMGSWQANTGASLHIIGRTLGHSSLRATHIYARLQLDPVRAAMETAAKAMLS